MSNTFTENPGTKTYTAANGHLMEVSPQFSAYDKTFYYVWSLAGHSDECTCNTWDVDDWGDMD